MSARFYAPRAGEPGDLVTLPDDEAQHLTRVLRLGPGDVIRVFDGRGREFSASVERADRTGVDVLLAVEESPAAPEPRVPITLAQAVLKGDKMDGVVRDAVMMGVAAIQPIVCARTEVTLPTLARARKRERWQKIAVSSAKQCGRATVPEVLQPSPVERVAAALTDLELPGPVLMLVEPGGAQDAVSLAALDQQAPEQAMLLVGPEGGWSAAEVMLADGLATRVTLGARTIRADSAALVAISALFARWGEF